MNRKITFLKKLDSLIGPPTVHLVKIFISPKKEQAHKGDSILFIRPGGMGDAILLLPAIEAVRNEYPNAKITILAEKRNREAFSLSSKIDEVLCYDRPSDLISVLKGRYDLVIDTEQWYRLSSVIAFLTRAPLRIGFATNERKKLFTTAVTYDENDYELLSFLKLISSLCHGDPLIPSDPFLHLSDDALQKVRSLLKSFEHKKIVVIFPGGSIPEKKWGDENFSSLSKALSEKGYGIVIIGGKAEMNSGNKIATRQTDALNFCGLLSLTETAAVIQQAALLITGDSGIMHVAYGAGAKTLSLFGPGNEKKWAPPGKDHVVICKDLNCRPCTRFGHTPRCKTDVECMKQISIEEVLDKAIEMLEG